MIRMPVVFQNRRRPASDHQDNDLTNRISRGLMGVKINSNKPEVARGD